MTGRQLAETPHSVLVTGSSGGVGRAIVPALANRDHRVRAFDRRLPDDEGHDLPLVERVEADLGDRDAVRRACEGVSTVVHLAAYPDDADFLRDLIEPNVRGLYHVFDAAREQGVRRVVLASTLQVITGHGWGQEVHDESVAPAPINHYGLTKLWAEATGEMYARVHGLEVVAARLGWLPRSEEHARELEAFEFGTRVYLSHDDAARFFTRSVEAPRPKPGELLVVNVTSVPVGEPVLDLDRARATLGFVPRDRWPSGMSFGGPACFEGGENS